MSGIYSITNLINGKRYIGQAVDIKRRWARHKYELRTNQHNNTHLQRAWNKCGEAPYLISRYDTTTGKPIEIERRIGILDRKLRIVNENTTTESEWLKWAYRAFEATYGFEYQGDNLFFARVNLVQSFIDYYTHRFEKFPTTAMVKKIATIVSWNLWQMDGLKDTTPFGVPEDEYYQLSIFEEAKEKQPVYCRIKNWRGNKALEYRSLKGNTTMKFDYCLSNVPYQQTRDTTKDMPVYHDFMNAAYTIAKSVELITPARFLFNAGATPKEWNKAMLNDKHFKVLKYEPDSKKVFPGTDIKGGVAIHYRDEAVNFGAIEVFTAFEELNQLREIIASIPNYKSLATIMYPYSTYTISATFWDTFPELKEEVEYISKYRDKLSAEEKTGKLSNLRIITTNIFDLLPDLFFDNKPDDGNDYVCLLGRQNGQRCKKYVLAKYIDVGENYNKWKVIIPTVNGSGAIGEKMATPLVGSQLVGSPLVGYTQTYLGIGAFDTEYEAKAAYKYVCSKFCRACLGILKITQHNSPEKWRFVPLQDFTSASDIDWSKSIPEIDQQLYAKYGLSPEEIQFIETHVKEMT